MNSILWEASHEDCNQIASDTFVFTISFSPSISFLTHFSFLLFPFLLSSLFYGHPSSPGDSIAGWPVLFRLEDSLT